MTIENQHDEGGWKPCEAGLISGFVRRHRSRRRVAFTTQVTAAATLVAVMILLVTGWPNFSSPPDSVRDVNYGGIVCSAVRSHARDFVRGDANELVAVKIRAHLKRCSHCSRLIEQMRRDKARNGLPPQHRIEHARWNAAPQQRLALAQQP